VRDADERRMPHSHIVSKSQIPNPKSQTPTPNPKPQNPKATD
jgi:hypothetical protein